MKKLIAALTAALMILALASCADGGGEINLGNDSTTATQQTVEEGGGSFSFNAGRVSVTPHGDFANVEQYLGEPVSKEVSASCAYIGYDKVFVYGGFTIQTYPDGDHDYVLWISVTDPSLKTEEGISIGSTEAEVRAAYGDLFEARGSAYVYKKGKTSLSFMISGGVVKAIQYMAE